MAVETIDLRRRVAGPPIFVDPSGRRPRRMRRLGRTLRVGLFAYFVLVASAFAQVSFVPSLRLPGVGRVLPPTGPHGLPPLGAATAASPVNGLASSSGAHGVEAVSATLDSEPTVAGTAPPVDQVGPGSGSAADQPAAPSAAVPAVMPGATMPSAPTGVPSAIAAVPASPSIPASGATPGPASGSTPPASTLTPPANNAVAQVPATPPAAGGAPPGLDSAPTSTPPRTTATPSDTRPTATRPEPSTALPAR